MLKWFLLGILIMAGSLSAETKVLAFAGSTREESCNKKLVKFAADLAKKMGATVTVIDLKDFPIPLYDADLEKSGMPENAKRLRRLMIQHDRIIIASPEYNSSIPSVLKNALDWASRSEDGKPSREAFNGKKFALMSCSPGSTGGARGLVHLREIIKAIGGEVVEQQVSVPDSYSAFNNQGLIENETIDNNLKKEIQQLLNN